MFLETFAIMAQSNTGRQFMIVASEIDGKETISLVDPSGEKPSTKLNVIINSAAQFDVEIHESEITSINFYNILDELNNFEITYLLRQPEMVGGFYTGTNIAKIPMSDYDIFMFMMNNIQEHF